MTTEPTATVADDAVTKNAARETAAGENSAEAPVQVWIDQSLCTGDGLCAQYAPEVFEFDVDGLAYVKDGSGELRTEAGSRVDVPARLRLEVIDAARDCPGECIHVTGSNPAA